MARGFEIPEAFLTGLAQLSYENKMLRKRLSDLEAAQLSHVLEGLGVIRETEATREVMSLSEQEKGRRS